MSRKQKAKFELWRDRTFSILIPVLFAYVLIFEDETNETIKIMLLMLLLGFATGQSALVGRHVISIIAKLLGSNHDDNSSRKNDNKNNT